MGTAVWGCLVCVRYLINNYAKLKFHNMSQHLLLTVTMMVTSVRTLWPLFPLVSTSVAEISMMKVPYTASSLSLSMMACNVVRLIS